MIDNINLKGHFKIQSIDKNNNIIDEYEDHNLIMESARVSMAEMFADLNTSTFINKFKLGTLGHIDDNILIPKGTVDGFRKERDRMFSEVYPTAIEINDVILIKKNDVLYINATIPGYYRFFGNDETLTITDTEIADIGRWEFIGTTTPYTYTIGFDLPQTNDNPSGTTAQNITEDDSGSGSTVKIVLTSNAVRFTIDIGLPAANEQPNTPGVTSIFTEAALYANDRIFAMKTFKAKIKDNSILLRVQWSIIF